MRWSRERGTRPGALALDDRISRQRKSAKLGLLARRLLERGFEIVDEHGQVSRSNLRIGCRTCSKCGKKASSTGLRISCRTHPLFGVHLALTAIRRKTWRRSEGDVVPRIVVAPVY